MATHKLTSNISLLNLPVEILHHIYDHLNTQDILRNIRSVCKRLYSTVITYNRYKIDSKDMKASDTRLLLNVIQSENITSINLFARPEWELRYEQDFIDWKKWTLPRLRSVSLHDFRSNNILVNLKYFLGCPLINLSISMREQAGSETLALLYSTLAQFNLQKICLRHLDSDFEHISWLAHSPIQDLTISTCSYKGYQNILQYLPFLKSLELCNWRSYRLEQATSPGFSEIQPVYTFSVDIFHFSILTIDSSNYY